MIYAVHVRKFEFVKIGFCDGRLQKRIAELQVGNPFKIEPVLDTCGTLMQERALHSSLTVAFGRIRIPMPPNEWYPGRNGWFKGFLESLKFGPDLALAYCEKYNPSVRQPGQHKREVSGGAPRLLWSQL